MELTREALMSVVCYEPDTGAFYSLVDTSHRSAGSRIDADGSHGYRFVSILGKSYPAHRLAWFYMHGIWPADHIDHKNRNRSDNSAQNLRAATAEQNNYNRGSWSNTGFRGVSKVGKRYRTTAKVDGLMKSFSFETFEAARDFYISNRSNIAGDFLSTDFDRSVMDRLDREKLLSCRNCSVGDKCQRHRLILSRLGPVSSW